MEENQFDALLEKVHTEIHNVDKVDEKGRELLEELDKDIRVLLAQGESSKGGRPFHQLLRDTIDYFEVTHPTLTTMLSELSNILNNAGI